MKGILPISINTIFWLFVGLIRDISTPLKNPRLSPEELALATAKTAICLPAHNEELVITNTLNSLLKLVPSRQIYVVSDGSNDRTAQIAKSFNCHVLEQNPSLGKAGAIEKTIDHFHLINRYEYLMIADADTIFDPNFVRHALPLFDDRTRTVVVAAFTKTAWRKHHGLKKNMFYVAYRYRLYEFIQTFLMHGQTWHRTNVNPVIPGFACLYKTSALKSLRFNTPGIIIEDFNMAFQLHKMKLGTIAHDSSVIAITQDPDNFSDYCRQLMRWNLGFFQTVKHWRIWPSAFWLSLGISTLEILIFSILLFLLPTILLLIALYRLTPNPLFPHSPTLIWLSAHWDYFLSIYLFLLIADYLITLYIALKSKEIKIAIYGLGFIFLRYLDATIFLYTLVKAFTTTSTGIWKPPSRRAQ